ncbi:PhoU domain-containing protein [Halalkalirubrum salinum]|uniref:PhoU domain-containing protein n=1 Tax=Halalkalirubrum salinum TaxID=2563889 RepID=UPI0010FB7F3B
MSNTNWDRTKRKIQFTGNSTYSVSLPKEWVQTHQICRSDPVSIYHNHDRLVIAPERILDEPSCLKIEPQQRSTDVVLQRIKAGFTAGYNQIIVTDPTEIDDRLRYRIHATVESLIGMEIYEETEERIEIRDHLDASALSISQSLAQLRQCALRMQQDAMEAVKTNNQTLAEWVRERDDQADRQFAFISREFHRGLTDITELEILNIDRTEGFRYYKIARQLERVADRAERVADVANQQPRSPGKDISQALTQAVSLAREIVEHATTDEGTRALTRYHELLGHIDAGNEAIMRRADAHGHLYVVVLESARRTAEYGLNIVNIGTEGSVSDLLGPSSEQE